MSECVKKMEECVAEIKKWMRKNMLKLNDKTEVLVLSTLFFSDRLHEIHIIIGNASVQAGESVRNLGVIFDSSPEMSNHTRRVCRVSFMRLRHLRSIS